MRMHIRFLVLAVVLAFGTLASPASAKSVLEVGIGMGKMVHLSRPVTNLYLADPRIADVQVKSPTLIYLLGKAGGTTNLYGIGANDELVLEATVNVSYNIGDIETQIRQVAPGSAITVRSVGGALVLEGDINSAAQGDDIRRVAAQFVTDPKQLVNRMKLDVPNQVNIRVRIAEVSRTIAKQLGINWNNVFAAGSASASFITAPNAISGVTANTITGGSGVGNFNLDAAIDALDSQGLITVLAEPNLTAVSGEPASFLAGGEFPIPVVSGGGGTGPSNEGQVTVEWKKFGVSLNFVATIVDGGRINLHVMPEVSQLTSVGAVTINGITIPALTTRRADTTVELGSGQSFAIAGLLQNNTNQNVNKFPWLGDVPVLGQLFRSETFQRNESDLVVIVTPYLVKPVSAPNALATPTDGFKAPSDRNIVLYGRDHEPTSVATEAADAPVMQSQIGIQRLAAPTVK